MTTRTITPEAVAGFRAQLISNSCSIHTIGRYLHDVISYSAFLGGQEVTSMRQGDGSFVPTSSQPDII